MRRRLAVLLLASISALIPCAWGQENWLQADFRREGERMGDACKGGFKGMPGCAIELFTDHPLHIAAGSMPPQNGFGIGGAFSESRNTRNWRLSWDLDAVGATSGAWRAGGYMTLVHTPEVTIHVGESTAAGSGGEAAKPKKSNLAVHPYTVFNLYAQTISLNKLNYFGLGNDTSLAGTSVFGMTQTIVGLNAIKPVYEWAAIRKLNLALLGEVNGRFVNIRGENGQSVPSIYTNYTNTTAPGLSSQPAFVQLAQGLRIKPVIADRLQLNYMGNFQEFFAPSSSQNSFERWTVDLNHTLFLYGYTHSGPKSTEGVGPDSCAPTGATCPAVSHSKNLNGSVNLRLLLSESMNSATSAVPFYFQQTLGGSDINSAMSLGSYQDYRFRAPDNLAFEVEFNRRLWKPLGIMVFYDTGEVAVQASDLSFAKMRHSFGGGLTLWSATKVVFRAYVGFGGGEGAHTFVGILPLPGPVAAPYRTY